MVPHGTKTSRNTLCNSPATDSLKEARSANQPGVCRKTYEDEGHAETIRQGFEPSGGSVLEISEFTVGEEDEESGGHQADNHQESSEARQWKQRDDPQGLPTLESPSYGSVHEEQQIWGAGDENKEDGA